MSDAASKQPITECLIIPRYTESSGVSSGYGHGAEAMSHSVFLATPLIYRAGDTFAPQEGNANGVFAFGAFAGGVVTIDGMTVVAPGYRSQWIWDLWDPLNPTYFELEPLSVHKALAEIHRVSSLLSQDELSGDERRTWDYAGDGAIEIRFTPEERDLVLAYLLGARSELIDLMLGSKNSKRHNHRLKQPAKAVTALAGACGESDTGPGSARSAPALAAAYPGR